MPDVEFTGSLDIAGSPDAVLELLHLLGPARVFVDGITLHEVFCRGFAAAPFLHARNVIIEGSPGYGLQADVCNLFLDAAIVRNNGRGLYVDGSGGVTNSFIVDNLGAAGGYGGVYLRGLNLVFAHNTVADNPSDLTFGDSVHCASDLDPSLFSNLFSRNEMGATIGENFCPDVAMVDSPGFVDASGGDYHLRPDAPGLDGGGVELAEIASPIGPDVTVAGDFDGHPRLIGVGTDPGADEVVGR